MRRTLSVLRCASSYIRCSLLTTSQLTLWIMQNFVNWQGSPGFHVVWLALVLHGLVSTIVGRLDFSCN